MFVCAHFREKGPLMAKSRNRLRAAAFQKARSLYMQSKPCSRSEKTLLSDLINKCYTLDQIQETASRIPPVYSGLTSRAKKKREQMSLQALRKAKTKRRLLDAVRPKCLNTAKVDALYKKLRAKFKK